MRTLRKSKDVSPKTSSKSKVGTPKTGSKTKSRKRNKSNANGSMKPSSGSSKALESEEPKAGTVSGKKRQKRVGG